MSFSEIPKIDYQQRFFEALGEDRLDVILCTICCVLVLFDSPFILASSIIKTTATAIDTFYQLLFEQFQDRPVGSISEISLVVDILREFRILRSFIRESKNWKAAMWTRQWSKVACVLVFTIRGICIARYLWANYDRYYDEYFGIAKVTPCYFKPEWVNKQPYH